VAEKKRKVGRPRTTGPGYAIQIRVHDNFLAALDAWIARERGRKKLSRPEAIRQLAWLALLQRGAAGG
jgi:hypothetical protein